MRINFSLWTTAAVVTAACVGCNSRPARVAVPEFDVMKISGQAIELYDRNQDGRLSSAEASKSLNSAMRRVDVDHDEQITAEEIVKRLKFYEDYRAGIVPVSCTVTRGGRPVGGAKVTYEPEPFMGENAIPGYGTTGDEGTTVISMSADHLPNPRFSGVQPGFYRVLVELADGTKVTKLDAGAECAGDILNTHGFALP